MGARAASHVVGLGVALAAALGLAACGGGGVEARAIWIDGQTGEGVRRIQIYDRGERSSFEVLGETGPTERVRLGPRGRGLLVRAGERAGAWFDLDDGRRLPLLLPAAVIGGEASVRFSARGDALWWTEGVGADLVLLPLAPGGALERRGDGSMVPLVEPGPVSWAVSAADAPVLLVAQGGELNLLRYPVEPGDADELLRVAGAGDLALPDAPREVQTCGEAVDCYTDAAVSARGEQAIVAATRLGPWSQLDARAPQLAGELDLPEPLADALDGGLGLLTLLERDHSVWLGAGQLYHWDADAGQVDSVPVFATPPLYWRRSHDGRALVLLATSGPTIRVDADGIELLNLETTTCSLAPASAPVVSPKGRFAAWTCLDDEAEFDAARGVVVRVSALGLERHVGVPMSPLAIDDSGALLLFSTVSIYTDTVDGVTPTSRPRSLFSLSREGVLTRVDELEPAPTPVLLGSSETATYIQGAAL